jgi:recombinational DNA repair protein RecR
MSFTEFPSRLLENAVNEFASLPGIGRKTAFRLVMNLLERVSSNYTGKYTIAKSATIFQILKYAISASMKRGRKR